MKAGATFMWASCCGLLNEVIKKHVCCDCKKDFCSVCSVLQENHRRCSTCHLLQETAFQRPRLMRLKVKDLRQYLILRNIPIDACREKEDLVDLVLCHHGLGSEDDLDTSSLNSSQSQTSTPSATVSSFQGELMDGDRTSRSGALAQVQSEIASANTEDDDDDEEEEEEEEEEDDLQDGTLGLSRKRVRGSLSDLWSLEEVEGMSVRQLKEILARNFVNYSGCCEKWELVEKVNRLYKENEENQKSYGERLQLQDEEDDSLCRICMDAVIDCCGKRMSECPICPQYVVLAVHVFKS
uniref:E3 ubiquitin-protein ligase RNF34 n=1 Tax=Sciurus vulgaris TaxID=55149 RepID=A0A8D2DNI8_SCIVU